MKKHFDCDLSNRHVEIIDVSANRAFGEVIIEITSHALDYDDCGVDDDDAKEVDQRTCKYNFDADRLHNIIDQLIWATDQASDFPYKSKTVEIPVKLGPISRFFHFLGL